MELVLTFTIGGLVIVYLTAILIDFLETKSQENRERELIKSIITREEYR